MCHRRTRMTRGRLLQPCSMIFLPNVQPFGEFLLVHFFQASLPSKSKLWMENVEKRERWRICFYFPTRVMFQVACQFLRGVEINIHISFGFYFHTVPCKRTDVAIFFPSHATKKGLGWGKNKLNVFFSTYFPVDSNMPVNGKYTSPSS